MKTYQKNNNVNLNVTTGKEKTPASIVKRLSRIQKGNSWVDKLGNRTSVEPMSNKEMADKLDMSPVRYSKIMKNNASLTICDLLNIISAFEVDPKWLLVGHANEKPFYLIELSSLLISLKYEKEISEEQALCVFRRMCRKDALGETAPAPSQLCCDEKEMIRRLEDFRAGSPRPKPLFEVTADRGFSVQTMASYLGIQPCTYSKMISNTSSETRKLHLEDLWHLIREFSELAPDDYANPAGYDMNFKKFDVNYLLYGYIARPFYYKDIWYYLPRDLKDASNVTNRFKRFLIDTFKFSI